MNQIQSQISKAYPHGPGRWRCRIKTPAGWRWCASADSTEAATTLAQALAGPVDSKENGQDAIQHHSRTSPDIVLDTPVHPARERIQNRAVKIEGPYKHRTGYRYRLVSSAGRQWAAVGKTQTAALKLAEGAAAKHAKQGRTTIKDALVAYLRYKEQEGIRPATIDSSRHSVSAYFRGMMDAPLWRITPRTAQSQYDLLRQSVDARNGRTVSVATHRVRLANTKTFLRWVIARGWMRGNPLDLVRGVGKKRRGKPQLRLDEAMKLSALCVQAARSGDAGAVATLMAMLMAMRASEVLSRTTRDLDNEGTLIRIDDNEVLAFRTKTESSRRPVKVPAVLRPILAARTAGKAPSVPLFPGTLGGRKRRQWLNCEVKRLCELAGVPVVCPHSLRGVFASALASTGESPEVVARVLGHTDSSMTLGHYIAPGVAEAAALERGLLAFTSQPSSFPG